MEEIKNNDYSSAPPGDKKPLSIEEQAILIKINIEHQKKHLDWFDYQTRGGRFKNKLISEVEENREDIINKIKELEKKFEELLDVSSNNGAINE